MPNAVIEQTIGKGKKTHEQRVCPVCEMPNEAPSFVRRDRSYIRCQRCRALYSYPPPQEKAYHDFMAEKYYENLEDLNASIQRARLPIYRKVIGEFPRYRDRNRLLDIGCGLGNFIRLAHDSGWRVWGIDPSRKACLEAEKIPGAHIFCQTIEQADFPENYFDVITLWNVVDYLLNPLQAIKKVRSWLRPGGLLLIRTPNASFHYLFYRVFQRVHGLLGKLGVKDPTTFARVNFEISTAEHMLRMAGFSHVRIRNGPMTEGDPYRQSTAVSKMMFLKGFLTVLSGLVAQLSWNRLLVGSNLVIRATKEPSRMVMISKGEQTLIIVKSFVLHLLAVMGYVLGLPLWRRLAGRGREIPVLLYHTVNAYRLTELAVTPDQFEKQLHLLKKKYTVIPLEKAVSYLRQGKLPDQPVAAITFDDGFEDNYRVAWPSLKAQNCPATIFILTGEPNEEREIWHLGEDRTPHPGRLLQWEEVREMAEAGISFGSHGESHRRFKDLNPETWSYEIVASKSKLERELGRPVCLFAYPYGSHNDVDAGHQAKVQEAGYTAAMMATYGTNVPTTPLFALRRIGIDASDSLFTVHAKLNGALDFMTVTRIPIFRRLIRAMDKIFSRRSAKVSAQQESLLVVSADFPPAKNGVSTLSGYLAEGLAQSKVCRVFAIGPQAEGDKTYDAAQPFRIFRFRGYHWGYLRFFPIAWQMLRVVFQQGVRHVFAMNVAYGGILCWALSFFWPVQYTVYAYGYEFEKVKHNFFIRNLYLRIYGRSRKVICCSKLVQDRLVAFGVPLEKIDVLYPAADCKRFQPKKVSDDFLRTKGLLGKRIILTVARLIERKGHDQILKALPLIIKEIPDVLYCIVGEGEQAPKLRERVRQLGLEPYVRFMSRVSEEELLDLYNASHLFAMPSREIEEEGDIEGFGIVFLEASACEKPVIGGRSGGMTEAIDDGKSGFIVDASSTQEVAGRVVYLLSNPSIAEKMGQHGREWARKTFSWEHYAKRSYGWLMGKDLP